MKTIISALILLSLLVLPFLASAQVMGGCTLRHDLRSISQKVGGPADNTCALGAIIDFSTQENYAICCTIDSIYSVTDWIFVVLMIIVGLMVAFGAFSIATAGGAPEKVQSGRNYILYAIVGMVVAFFARAIPAIVKMIIGA